MHPTKNVRPGKKPSPLHQNRNRYYEGKSKKRTQDIRAAFNKGAEVFVFTSATNDTPADLPFIRSLETYCEHNSGLLGIVRLYYKNPDVPRPKDHENTWSSHIEDYLISGRLDLGGIVVLADQRISPTASRPLTSKEPIEGSTWTIFGHTQIAMKTVPSPPTVKPKRMYTTGACTRAVYAKKDLSARAEFHHVVGAVVVEITKDFVFVRQLLKDSSGGFYDLDKYYRGGNVLSGQRALALNCGDEHERIVDELAVDATFGVKGLVSLIRPKYIFRHDVLDSYAVSHHHVGRTSVEHTKWQAGEDDIHSEIVRSLDYLNDTTPKGSVSVIVRSNHHDHVDQWLDRADSRKDFVNADFIDTMRLAQRVDLANKGDGHIYRMYGEKYLKEPKRFRFLGYNSPFILKGVDMANHGHLGVNGSKGSLSCFAKVVTKTFIAHGHSPGIEKGCYQIGKKAKKAEYERGYSSHSHTDGVLYNNGKRTLIDFHKGQFRGTNQRKITHGKKAIKRS